MEKTKNAHTITWDFNVPLVTNRFMLATTIKLCVITGIIMILIFLFLGAITQEMESFYPFIKIIGYVVLGLFILMELIMLLIFQNKMPMKFTLNPRGVLSVVTSKTAKTANWIAIIVGILGKKPGVAGAGLMAMSQEQTSYEWGQIAKVKYYEKQKTIILSNSWRQLVMLFCTEKNYDEVATFIREHIAKQDAKRAIPVKNPLPSLFIRTILTILACAPLYINEFPVEVDLFMPILVTFFAIATVWLIPLFGYVVIFGLLIVWGDVVIDLMTVYTPTYDFLEPYHGYEVLDEPNFVTLGVLVIGSAYLIWSSWKAIKGKYTSALFSD